MNRTMLVATAFAALTLLGFAAFRSSTPSQDPPKPTPTPPQDPPKPTPTPTPGPTPAQTPPRLSEDQRLRDPSAPLRFTGIPGPDREKSAKQYEPVCKWLAKEITRPVEFVPVPDYAAALAGLATSRIDMVWVNAVAAVQAETVTGHHCQPIFAREQDLKNKCYFIANKKLVDAGKFKVIDERKPMTLDLLAALKPNFAGLAFSFGAKNSGPGHFMPRYFLEKQEVGIDPEKYFKQKSAYAEAGDAAVLSSVAAGTCDLGVVDSSAWENAKDDLKAQAPVIFVTPEYLDCCMVFYTRPGFVALPLRVTTAFMRLTDPTVAEQKAILDAFGTKKFVGVGYNTIEPIRATIKSATERKLLE